MERIESMTDGELTDCIRCIDRMGKPIELRFDGDDTEICELMSELGLKQTIVDKLLINSMVMREAISRGLNITRGNQ